MIKVKIEVNGKVIGEISAVNKGLPDYFQSAVIPPDLRLYELSNGKKVYHLRKDGAVRLAQKMLDFLDESDLIPEDSNDLVNK